MKNVLFILILGAFVGCGKKNTVTVPTPSNISNLTAEARVGAALVKWVLPQDTAYDYVEVSYMRNGVKRVSNVSKHTDSVLITGLLNKLDYTFTVQTVNNNGSSLVRGNILTSNSVKPIRRANVITYFTDTLTRVSIPGSALIGYTQEPGSGAAVSNLVDGDKNTFWHSAWSTGVQPLPHYIKITLDQPVTIGLIKYLFRQNADVSGRPSQIGLEVSDDGNTWTRVYTSPTGLPTDAPAVYKTLFFDGNFTSKYFKVMILLDGSMRYTHIAEMEFYTVKSAIIDKELEAEANYNNSWL